jgi:poly-gamma-glutamate capsule biosynthesis protein CapA/YwtB (metallophosphatase superfamily)
MWADSVRIPTTVGTSRFLIELLLAGDVNLKRDLDLGPDALDLVRGALEGADLRLGNLEGAFHDPTVELPYKPGWLHCEPEQADALAGLFDAVNCANNVHYGPAIADSLAALDRLGIAHTGAGANRAAAREPAIVESGGMTIGVLGYTWIYWPTGHVATDDTPGVSALHAHTAYEPGPRLAEMPGTPAVVHTWPDDDDLRAARQDVARLAAHVDHVVVYCHWGISLDPEVCAYQRTAAHAFVDAGARIVAGSHSHTLQAAELYRGAAIFYGLGNFVFGWKLHRHATRDGLLARVLLDRDGIARCSVQPVSRTERDQAALLDPHDGLGRGLAELCVPLGTRTTVEGEEIVVS